MAIWMDMTNSLKVWPGNVVGIVRAELEIARNIKKINANVKFSLFNGQAFEQIPDEELGWLFNCEDVTIAYFERMGREEAGFKAENAVTKIDFNESQKLKQAYGYSQSRVTRLLRALILIIKGMPLILRPFLLLVWLPLAFFFKIVSGIIYAARLIICSLRKKERTVNKASGQKNALPQNLSIAYPYSPGDVIFSAGWFASDKERAFGIVKDMCARLYIVYLIYDTILINDATMHLYTQDKVWLFKEYYEWALINCDFIIYGGDNTRRDSESIQRKLGMPTVPSSFVRFGANIFENSDTLELSHVLKKYDIPHDFILSVGSVEPRKNYETLHRAISYAIDIKMKSMSEYEIPALVIVGAPDITNFGDIIADIIRGDPKTVNYIRMIRPTDKELFLLYKNCLFTILPSLYEGWSLVLPESLSFAKFVIASDIAPLREAGEDFCEYVSPYNAVAWAEKILYYANNRDELKIREKHIADNYSVITWLDCAKQISTCLTKAENAGNR
jgi:glycosyltransferase involved in cell wall biosynthesis